MQQNQHRINHQIRLPRIQVIDQNGQNHGIIATNDAMKMARDAELDLVEISPTAKPPVCRIMNYGQFKYQQKKKQKQNKQKQVKIKDVRLRPNTAKHDIDVLLRRSRGFLEKGNKVSIQVQFKGREMAHRERGTELLQYFMNELKELGKIETPIRWEGNTARLLLAPHGE